VAGPRTLSERARARVAALESASGEWIPPAPRGACTVILVRDGEGGPETFLIRRADTMKFAAKMHVFPGGKVDPIDAERKMNLGIGSDERAELARRASIDETGLDALYSCAAREVLEEVGVHLGTLDAEGVLHIDVHQLPIVGQMITPEIEDRRYDVRFFVAALAPGTHVEAITTEAVEGFWISARQALARNARGDLTLLTPTIMRLQELAVTDSVEEFLTQARQFNVLPLMPKPVVDANGAVHWMMVNERTGEVLDDGVRGPDVMETDGAPIHEDIS
jgi:8-oxo-dGTP pyrophosphatase MutT (NUDIX family)